MLKNLATINKLEKNSDSLGSIASGLCLIHCIATPLLFAIQPLSAHAETPGWWSSIDIIFLVVSFFAVYASTKNSSKKWVAFGLWMNFIALTAAILNEKLELFHLGELVVYIPAIALVGLHLYNRKYCKCEDDTCCATE